MFDHNCSCKVAINMLLVGEGGLGKMYPDSNIDYKRPKLPLGRIKIKNKAIKFAIYFYPIVLQFMG